MNTVRSHTYLKNAKVLLINHIQYGVILSQPKKPNSTLHAESGDRTNTWLTLEFLPRTRMLALDQLGNFLHQDLL